MFDIVLVHPEIPPNTGNIIRLAANAGARLHLVEPLGFSLDDKRLKRAGLDYHDLALVKVHASWGACRATLAGKRLFALTPKAKTGYAEMRYREGDAFVFGAEASGLPDAILGEFSAATRLLLPIRPGNRSLNLLNP